MAHAYFAGTPYIKAFINRFSNFARKDRDIVPLNIERAKNILVERPFATRLREVVDYVQSKTKRGDYVYVFPNEPIYYFLLDRKRPIIYDTLCHVATRQQRRQILEDLDKHRPEYIVYTLDTWRMDGISEEVSAPEITSYIKANYKVEKTFEGTQIL